MNVGVWVRARLVDVVLAREERLTLTLTLTLTLALRLVDVVLAGEERLAPE